MQVECIDRMFQTCSLLIDRNQPRIVWLSLYVHVTRNCLHVKTEEIVKPIFFFTTVNNSAMEMIYTHTISVYMQYIGQ